MPLTAKGEEIKKVITKEYGAKKGEQVLYAGKNKGTFTGIDSFNSEKMSEAKKEGAVKSSDSYAQPVTAMSAGEVNKKADRFWNGQDGNLGPAESEASAPSLAGTKVSIPVWRGAHDEVSPTQSAPPDSRSDNLLERAHGGIPGTESLTSGSVPNPLAGDAVTKTAGPVVKQGNQQSATTAHATARAGMRLSPGELGIIAARKDAWVASQKGKQSKQQDSKAADELVEGSEAMSLGEHQTDSGIGRIATTRKATSVGV
jgi:hypothetical protein